MLRAPAFWDAPAGRLPPAARALVPLSWMWQCVHRLRWAVARPERVPVPVVCVGNVVAGGAGKTPVALAVGRLLAVRGLGPQFVTRGTGGREPGPLRVDPGEHTAASVGDEALLLAEEAPAWVARDRAAGARAAAEAGAGAVILDDGFQSPNVVKDVSLLVADAAAGFSNGRVLPAGPLREPAARALARASAVIVLETEGAAPAAALGALASAAVPVLGALLAATADSRRRLGGARVVAFAGIARPAKFFATVEALGCTVEVRRAFPDHHRYRESELAALVREADAHGARLVTTAKDRVRLSPEAYARAEVLDVEVRFDDPAAVEAVLAPVFAWRP